MLSAKLALPRSCRNFLVLYRVNKPFRGYSAKKSAQSCFGFRFRRGSWCSVTSGRVVYPIPLETPSSRWLSSCLRNSVKHLSTFPVFHFTKFYLNRNVLCWAKEDFCRAIFESSKPLVINWPAPKRKPQSFWGIFFAILNLVVSS